MTENEKNEPSTRERAKIAALELLLAGTCPTNDSVRKQMGGTGSNSTINPALREFWKKDLPEKLKALLFIPELPEDVSLKFMEFWATAIETATGAAEQVKTQALSDLEVARQAETALQEQLAELNAEIVQYQEIQKKDATLKQTLAEKLSAAEAVNSSLSAQVDAIRTDTEKLVSAANHRADSAEAKIQQEAQRAEATKVRLLTQMEEQKAASRKQDEAHAEKVALLTGSNQEKDQRIKDLSAELAQVRKGLDRALELESKLAFIRGRLSELEIANKSVIKEKETLRADLSSIQSALDKKTGENKVLLSRVKERIKPKNIRSRAKK